jgi:crotonobetainyl-CoA:carnitine CoA-transferase CaiB-like acyl-CoA transferase
MSSLKGIRIVEISTSVAGPYAGQILADLGGEVIKVERPGTGDDSRAWGPPFWGEESATFLALNRNKRSIAVNFRSSEGRQILEQLISTSDVLIQNLRPGTLAAAGLDAPAVLRLNPKLVYCEITGYGSRGPMAQAPAYDPMIQAYSGMVDLTGEAGGPPARVPVSILDMGSAMWTAIAVLDGLRSREITGAGVHCEVSLLGTALAWMTIPLSGILAGGGAPVRLGSGMAGIVPHGAFSCADGHIFLSAGNQALWERMTRALGRDDLAVDDRFRNNPSRVARRAEVTKVLEDEFSDVSVHALLATLRDAGVPCAPVNALADVISDEPVRATEMVVPAQHSDIGDYSVVATPIMNDGRYPKYRRQPPRVGQDSLAILTELGIGPERCGDLIRRQIIGNVTTDTAAEA